MIAAAVPLITIVPVPSPVTVTPDDEPRLRMPLVTDTVVVNASPSMSATVKAVPLATLNTRVPSSAIVCAPGAVETGASFTALTVTLTVAVSVTPPEVTVYVKVSVPLKFRFGV